MPSAVTPALPPPQRPCPTCPYRCDVPSGVWDASEYAKLPPYDGPTWAQPDKVFMCHQADGRVCAGWAATHDMDHSLALRVGVLTGQLTERTADEIAGYSTDVALFPTGAAAAKHGLADIDDPGPDAVAAGDLLRRKREQRRTPSR